MSAFDRVLSVAKRHSRRVVLPESYDERVLKAAATIHQHAIAQPILLGESDTLKTRADTLGIALDGIETIDPATSERRSDYVQALVKKRAHRGMTLEKAEIELNSPVTFACMMVSEDDADACVAGAATPTADVVRNAMRYVGKSPDKTLVSSCFVMLTQPHHPVADVLVIGDCALVIDPDAEQLAGIAVSTGETAKQLLQIAPRLAMLSFSTLGSARHAAVTKVIQATELARQKRPDWQILGDIQLDAAVIPEILQKKAPNMASKEPSNVLIFPTLDAGNIGYKLIERFGGAQAIGPILQGLNKPVNDLSRGCSTDDIINIVAVSAAQVQD